MAVLIQTRTFLQCPQSQFSHYSSSAAIHLPTWSLRRKSGGLGCRSGKNDDYYIDAPVSPGDGFSFSGGKYSDGLSKADEWFKLGKMVKAYAVRGATEKAKDPIFGLAMGGSSQAASDYFRWFCVESGSVDKPVIILMHGFPSQAYSYRKVLPILSKNYRVITFDWLGFGFSDKPQAKNGFNYTLKEYVASLGSLINELGVDKVSLVVQVQPRNKRRSNAVGMHADVDEQSASDESDDDINDCMSDDNITPDGIESEDDEGSDYLDRYCRHKDRYLKTEKWKHAIRMVGQIFHDGSHNFRLELAQFAIVSGFEYEYKKNESARVSAQCKFKDVLGCPWFIHAIYNKSRDIFYIRKMCNKHTCNRIYSKLEDSRMVCSIIADEIIDQFNHKSVISPRDVVREFKQDYGMEVSYMKAWRGVQEAKSKHYGMHASTYDQLIGLIKATTALNQGTEMFVEFDTGNQRFQRFFAAYGPCLQGFKYCRPLLFLDGTFLKSRYKGTLLIATAKDANQGIYPIAFAVVDSETIENWSWFLDSLSQCISRDRPINFISDRNKGILEAVTKIFPDSPHGFCMLHLRANLKERLGGTPRYVKKRILDCLWKAAQTPYKDECIKLISEMTESSDKVQPFLSNAPLENWTNSHFAGNRYGELYSNAAESFNAWIRNERNLPVKNMVDDIRRKLMTRMSVRRKMAKNVSTILCPKFYKWYEKAYEKGRAWIVHSSDDSIYEVMSSPSHVVNIQERTCSCIKWQIRGFPCSHSIAAILSAGTNLTDYVDDYCKAEFWYKAHEVPILPTPSISQQVFQIGEIQVYPPITRIPPGRPRKNRISSRSERVSQKRHMTCSRCNKKGGHNKRSCTASIHE